VPHAQIGVLISPFRFLDDHYRHLAREAREEVLGPLPNETPAQM
jgi:hypothetical protein